MDQKRRQYYLRRTSLHLKDSSQLSWHRLLVTSAAAGTSLHGIHDIPLKEKEGITTLHFAVVYEWDNGARGFLTCRQVPNCSNDNTDWIAGTKGIGFVNGWAPRQSNLKFADGSKEFRYKGGTPNMYQTEHNELFKAIRENCGTTPCIELRQHINDPEFGRHAAETLLRLMQANQE